MSEYLSADISWTVNFDTEVHHFKGAPMFVIQQVLDQPTRILLNTGVGVGHTGHVPQ